MGSIGCQLAVDSDWDILKLGFLLVIVQMIKLEEGELFCWWVGLLCFLGKEVVSKNA